MNIHKFNVKPKHKPHKTIKWLIPQDVKHSVEKINTNTWNEVNLEDTINIITTISNNSKETITIQENELLCFVCYKKL